MTGAAGLVAASGSGLVHYALPADVDDLVRPQLAAHADRSGWRAAAALGRGPVAVPNAGELSQARNQASSRHRVTTTRSYARRSA